MAQGQGECPLEYYAFQGRESLLEERKRSDRKRRDRPGRGQRRGKVLRLTRNPSGRRDNGRRYWSLGGWRGHCALIYHRIAWRCCGQRLNGLCLGRNRREFLRWERFYFW